MSQNYRLFLACVSGSLSNKFSASVHNSPHSSSFLTFFPFWFIFVRYLIHVFQLCHVSNYYVVFLNCQNHFYTATERRIGGWQKMLKKGASTS